MLKYLLLIIVAAAGFGSAAGAQDLVDGVAAQVNDDVITYSEVRELSSPRERALRQIYRGDELVEKIKEARLAALRDLIDRQLVLQEFEESGFQIPDRIIDSRIKQIITEEFDGDREAFLRTLKARGITLTEFRKFERDKMIVQAMRQRKVGSNIVVSPTKIKEYYQENRDQFSESAQVKLRMISIGKDAEHPGSSPESQRAVAEEIRQKLVEGADFSRMAQIYSDDSTSDNGGDWGWIDEDTLNAELSRQVFKLKPGEISPVIDSGSSYYIMLVEAKKNASVKPLSDVRDQVERALVQEKRSEQLDRWLDSLREKAYIKMH